MIAMRLPDDLLHRLENQSRTWLVTGVAGFIGSNILQALLQHNQVVRGLDNLATGCRHNLDEVKSLVSPEQWSRFEFIQGDIRDAARCREACRGAHYVLHQAALGSVPLSLDDPVLANEVNVGGTLNMLLAARDAQARRFVFASSCAVYGDLATFPIREEDQGNLLSPYAVTKFVNELYARNVARCYGLATIGLRYFNVFGPRQDPNGAYAAVIPKWIDAMFARRDVYIHGDGETSRDFCHVDNIVQANLLAALTENPEALNQSFNVGLGQRTSLNQLYALLQSGLASAVPGLEDKQAVYDAFRPGDVRHSQADISRAQKFLGYAPMISMKEGLEESLGWYEKLIRDREDER